MLNWDPRPEPPTDSEFKVGDKVLYDGKEYEVVYINPYAGDTGVWKLRLERELGERKKSVVHIHSLDLVKKIVEDKEMSSNKDVKNCRAYILDEAKRCVCGERENQYGSPENNFNMIASLWNDYLYHGLKEGQIPKVINAVDVAMMMSLLKIARIRTGEQKTDSFIDLAGYAACGGEIENLLNDICPE